MRSQEKDLKQRKKLNGLDSGILNRSADECKLSNERMLPNYCFKRSLQADSK